MRIIYGYSNCTDSTYNRIVSERNVSTMVPDQKYHSLLIKGLAKNGAEVRCISGLPVNRTVTSRKLVYEKDEQEGNASFHYITTLNIPILRQLMIYFGAFFSVIRVKKDRNTYAICDFLNTAVAFAFVSACRIKQIPLVAIVTDLPDMFDSGKTRKALGNFLLRRFDAYVFLTEYMNDIVNSSGKPYIVLEGHVDSELPFLDDVVPYESETGKRIVIYAGSIQKKYGIENLVKGFIIAGIPCTELWVFGDGDYRDELEALAEQHSTIKYMGIKSNAEVVAVEQRAALLVNPRPTSAEYTKYSFPSKNMEYMVSGTPMLTTKLPGMPAEYYPYVYLIEDETPDGIADVLKKIFSESLEVRREKAKRARAFVLENKSNVVQAKKIIKFLENEL